MLNIYMFFKNIFYLKWSFNHKMNTLSTFTLMLFQICMTCLFLSSGTQKKVFWRMLVAKLGLCTIDFHSMDIKYRTWNCLVYLFKSTSDNPGKCLFRTATLENLWNAGRRWYIWKYGQSTCFMSNEFEGSQLGNFLWDQQKSQLHAMFVWPKIVLKSLKLH